MNQTTNSKTELVFIYNADSGLVSAVLDSAHKLISPSTYQCELCSITHGLFGEREAWRKFRESFDGIMTFLHRDETDWQGELPIILLRVDGTETVVGDKAFLASCKDTGALIDHLQQAIDNTGASH